MTKRKSTPTQAKFRGGFAVARKASNATRLAEIGQTGLRQFGGIITEEWLRKLQGEVGRRTFREMADNDPTIGALLFAVEMLLRNVDWRVEPFSDDPLHVEQADVVSSLPDDMSYTWEDLIAEVLTMLVFGWSAFEICYKRRVGPLEKDPTKRSKHTDGLIGWRKLAPRAQDSLNRWEMSDDDGGVTGLWQDLVSGGTVFIPIEKLLIFKTTSRKSNPEGRSVLRNAFLPWYRKTRIEESEAIGVERDLVGLPVFYAPSQIFDENAAPDLRSQLAEYQRTVENLKNDEQAGLVLPSIYDDAGNQLVKFELASSPGTRTFDTAGIAGRYDQQILRVVLADFIALGHEKVGSFSLSSDKTEMFGTALGAWLKEIASVLNRHALPRLYALNGWDPSEAARFVPGDVEKPEIEAFAAAVTALTGSGWITPGGFEDETAIRERVGLPDTPEEREDFDAPLPPGPDQDAANAEREAETAERAAAAAAANGVDPADSPAGPPGAGAPNEAEPAPGDEEDEE